MIRRAKLSRRWRSIGNAQVRRERGRYSDGTPDGRQVLYIRIKGTACAVVSTPYPDSSGMLDALSVLVGGFRLTPNATQAAHMVRDYLREESLNAQT